MAVDHTKIINWLTEYITDNKLESFVVGVSGGIDSAVTSTLCALTGIPTYVINLPLHQNVELDNLSDIHLKWLTKFTNIRPLKMNLSNTFDCFVSTLKRDLGSEFYNELAFANTKSRLRMLTLYQIAQSKNGIVVGTGNKVEDFGVGFFTKYGDGGVDIAPIADLYKSEVYELGCLLEVDERILRTPPTDGLWDDGRTDEMQLQASYEELEWAMKSNGIFQTERQREILEIYNNLRIRNTHKMIPIPVYKNNL